MTSQKLAIVTGAEGFIGSNLVRELLEQKWEVVALHYPTSDLARLAGLAVENQSCDIRSISQLKTAVPANADAIFHLAADLRITSRRIEDQRQVNINGTRNVLQVAREHNCRRFLFTSSMGAYGLHSKRINEHTTSNALELDIPYFKSKFLGELEVDEAIAKGLDSVIVNPSNVAGPGDTKNMPATYIRLVYSGILPFIGRGIHSFCHVREVVRAMITCLERGRTGERYLLGGADTDFLTMGRCIEKIIDGRAPRTTVPAWVFRLTANVISRYAGLRGGHTFLTPELARLLSSNMLVDSGKAIRELDYKPVPLEEMIADSAQWLKEHGYLIPYSGWTWR